MRSLVVGTAILFGLVATLTPSSASATYGTPPPKPGCPTIQVTPDAPVFRQKVVIEALGITAGANILFKEGNVLLAQVASASGTATLETTKLEPGPHTVVAVYPDGTNASGALVVTVFKASTKITLSQATEASNLADNATFTAVVASVPGPVADGGEVVFQEGTTTLGSAPLKDGAATFSFADLALGPHQVTAIYKGTSEFIESTSTTVLHQVAATPVVAPVDPAPAAPAQPAAPHGDEGKEPTKPGDPAAAKPADGTDDGGACAATPNHARSGSATAWLIGLALVAARLRRRKSL